MDKVLNKYFTLLSCKKFYTRHIKVSWYFFTFLLTSAFFFISLFVVQRYLSKDQDIIALANQQYVEEVSISRGSTLSSLLKDYNLPPIEVDMILNAAKPHFNLANLKMGSTLQLKLKQNGAQNRIFKGMSLKLSNEQTLQIDKVDNAQYSASLITIPFTKSIVLLKGVISDSIVASAIKEGVPIKNIMEVIGAYSYKVDFQREVKSGDSFKLLVEKFVSSDGKTTYFGKTLFSALNLSGKAFNIYKYQATDGSESFFDDNYMSIRGALIKTPIMAARISSRFGMREHPILGFSQVHKGVDFAAPMGTPVYAAGKGKVFFMGVKGAYGKYIRIAHANNMHTAYAHLKNFAKNLSHGADVAQGQVIGYVGATGRATGPHLHYEVLVNNQHINPLSIKSTPDKILAGKDREEFRKVREQMDSLIS